ncbi:DUF6602 domain-containing protein [Aquisediminimonas sediminicola]|uniref:DUF6602 domain-containing protein n=1 Tax=Alteraquisediminimonas sediminicola TaxID=2676787 RepID=UPI001C8D3FBC|nr:DUF6602 domain-containing protein [Aquisediminimonas sediminicola]
MTGWSLTTLLSSLNDGVRQRLQTSRDTMGHPVLKGDASEAVWLSLLSDYLPERYQAARAVVIDSENRSSDQLDIVIFDRQYSPFVFQHDGVKVIPAESVYAVFEAKQSLDAAQVDYAHKKIASVRALHRTSLPIPHAGGTYPPRPLPWIIGGILTLESEWKPALGAPLEAALAKGDEHSLLDIGCVAAQGLFYREELDRYVLAPHTKAATAFLLELIARLQTSATVPMIDVRAYARWLAD